MSSDEGSSSLVIRALKGCKERFSGNMAEFEAFCKLPEED
jgi:hypothetical protein